MQVRYRNLDGIRAYSCIGIISMHVLYNGYAYFSGFIFKKLIPSFTELIFLFMILSSFSLCCGYYEHFINGNYDLDKFYLRRIQRLWPCFALLCTIELIMDFKIELLFQWLADLTLVFGLIPNNNITVIGVGWFLGVIFVFYMIFPFFVFLIKTKKRAWITAFFALMIHILCNRYFLSAADRTNFIFDAVFFVAGGLIYLYKEQLSDDKFGKIALIICICSIFFNYLIFTNSFLSLLIFSSLIIWSIASTDFLGTSPAPS